MAGSARDGCALNEGDYCEFVGPDDPDHSLWHGAPGLVIDVPTYEPPDPAVSFVGRPDCVHPRD